MTCFMVDDLDDENGIWTCISRSILVREMYHWVTFVINSRLPVLLVFTFDFDIIPYQKKS